MSSDLAIRLDGVGKMYKLFSSRSDNLLDALGLGRALPWHRVAYKELWALRGVGLQLGRGERMGIIGRNGAGKSTLLKLITGNLAPTEGTVDVNGQVQALLEAGAGFHPDFTGYENIRAALLYQGLRESEIAEAEADIAEFTELGDFLSQPFKTYSTGMQARLAFATATVLRPQILIIDEILGAGDAYFIGKSTERMRQLVGSGASILLVSHAMGQITQICERALWLDRGEVVMMGESLEVVKSYEQYIRQLEDRRLQAKNKKRRVGVTSSIELEQPAASVVLRFVLDGTAAGSCDISEVKLSSPGDAGERVRVGAPQDANPMHPGFVVLDGSDWSPPQDSTEGFFRRLVKQRGGTAAAGLVAINIPALEENEDWELAVDYRLTDDASLGVELWLGEKAVTLGSLAPGSGWREQRFPLRVGHELPRPSSESVAAPMRASGSAAKAVVSGERSKLYRWPGEGSFKITGVDLLDRLGRPAAVFEAESLLRLEIHFEVVTSGRYELLPVAVIYRLDGLNVSSQIGDWLSDEFEQGRPYRASLTLDPLNLGNGNYVISVALYKTFDPELNRPPVVYDWIDRSIEFQVVGTPPAITSVFLHPSRWTIE
jgi:lipopolysaccharide transport system ATP-binding protein